MPTVFSQSPSSPFSFNPGVQDISGQLIGRGIESAGKALGAGISKGLSQRAAGKQSKSVLGALLGGEKKDAPHPIRQMIETIAPETKGLPVRDMLDELSGGEASSILRAFTLDTANDIQRANLETAKANSQAAQGQAAAAQTRAGTAQIAAETDQARLDFEKLQFEDLQPFEASKRTAELKKLQADTGLAEVRANELEQTIRQNESAQSPTLVQFDDPKNPGKKIGVFVQAGRPMQQVNQASAGDEAFARAIELFQASMDAERLIINAATSSDTAFNPEVLKLLEQSRKNIRESVEKVGTDQPTTTAPAPPTTGTPKTQAEILDAILKR